MHGLPFEKNRRRGRRTGGNTQPLRIKIQTLVRVILAVLVLICLVACQNTETNPLADSIANNRDAVIRVYGPGFSCSGFHLGDGLFITAAHCAVGEPLVWIENQALAQQIAVPILLDVKKDLAVIRALKTINLPVAKLKKEGQFQRIGTNIVSLGFPGYWNLGFMFETGEIRDMRLINEVRIVIAKEMAYMGYSGGPVLDVATGVVVGMSSAMTETIVALPIEESKHQHITLSFIISSDEIHAILHSLEGQNE